MAIPEHVVTIHVFDLKAHLLEPSCHFLLAAIAGLLLRQNQIMQCIHAAFNLSGWIDVLENDSSGLSRLNPLDKVLLL